MSWDTFFDHLVTYNPLLFFAKIAVHPSGKVIVIVLPILLGMVIFISILNREKLKIQKRFLVFGLSISGIAEFSLLYLTFGLTSPQAALRKLGLHSFWQMSPDGVTDMLNYLIWLGVTELILGMVVVIWIIVISLLLRREKIHLGFGGAWSSEEEDSTQEDPKSVQHQHPESKNSMPTTTYQLCFLADEKGEITHAQFGNGKVIEAGMGHPIETLHLFFYLPKNESFVRIYSSPPATYGAELKKLSDTEFLLNKEKIAVNQVFYFENIRFKIVSDTAPAPEHSKNIQGTLALIAFFLTLIALMLAYQVSAAGDAIPTVQDEKCFIPVEGNTETLTLTYKNNNDDVADAWQVSKKMKIGVHSLSAILEMKNNELLVVDENVKTIDSVSWTLTGWETKMAPLHIKVVFDLDRNAIYNSHVIVKGTGRITEKEFWDKLLATILTSFDLDDTGNGDIVSVYSLRQCDTYEPGHPIYFDDRMFLAESLTRTGIENRMRKVIFDCTYRAKTDTQFVDVSEDLLEVDLPKEITKEKISTDDDMMIIIRWSDTPISIEKGAKIPYAAGSSALSQDKLLVVEIVDNPDDLLESRDNIVRLLIPTIDGERNSGQLTELAEKLERMAERNTSVIRFSAITSSLMDDEVAKQMKLQLTSVNGCESPAMSLDWNHNSDMRKDYWFISIVSVAAVLFLLTVVAISDFRWDYCANKEGDVS